MEWGCTESFIGMCICPQDMDLSDYVEMSGQYNKEMCYDDMCNQGESSKFTCFKGTVTRDLNNDQIIFDDTKEVVCSQGEVECFKTSVVLSHSEWEVESITGGCFNPMYTEYYDVGVDETEKYMAEGATVTSYLFESCNTSSCFSFAPEDSEVTITCNSGLTVTDEYTDEVIFSQHSPEQCKVHDFCETLTLSQSP